MSKYSIIHTILRNRKLDLNRENFGKIICDFDPLFRKIFFLLNFRSILTYDPPREIFQSLGKYYFGLYKEKMPSNIANKYLSLAYNYYEIANDDAISSMIRNLMKLENKIPKIKDLALIKTYNTLGKIFLRERNDAMAIIKFTLSMSLKSKKAIVLFAYTHFIYYKNATDKVIASLYLDLGEKQRAKNLRKYVNILIRFQLNNSLQFPIEFAVKYKKYLDDENKEISETKISEMENLVNLYRRN